MWACQYLLSPLPPTVLEQRVLSCQTPGSSCRLHTSCWLLLTLALLSTHSFPPGTVPPLFLHLILLHPLVLNISSSALWVWLGHLLVIKIATCTSSPSTHHKENNLLKIFYPFLEGKLPCLCLQAAISTPGTNHQLDLDTYPYSRAKNIDRDMIHLHPASFTKLYKGTL